MQLILPATEKALTGRRCFMEGIHRRRSKHLITVGLVSHGSQAAGTIWISIPGSAPGNEP